MIKHAKAVTLLELLSVVIIIAILVALALPRFGTMKERALDNEAKANLKLIQAAEKIYRMEAGFYYPFNDTKFTQDLNINLKLSLPTGANRNWDYQASGGATLDARAYRNVAPTSSWYRNFRIDEDDEAACCCPRDSQCLTQEWCSSCP